MIRFSISLRCDKQAYEVTGYELKNICKLIFILKKQICFDVHICLNKGNLLLLLFKDALQLLYNQHLLPIYELDLVIQNFMFYIYFQTRLMNQRKLKQVCGLLPAHIYSGTIDCFIQTFRNEGFWAFYKGFVPTLFRMGPWNIIFFITYEQLKQLY